MASADASVRAGFKSDEHGAAPSFDNSNSEKTWLGIRDSGTDIPSVKVRDERSADSQRFEDLIESNGNPRSHIP
jgi:hypothetical protein